MAFPAVVSTFFQITYLISGIDFEKKNFGRAAFSEHVQVILRLLYVVLVQCTSHNTAWRSSQSKSETARNVDQSDDSKVTQVSLQCVIWCNPYGN